MKTSFSDRTIGLIATIVIIVVVIYGLQRLKGAPLDSTAPNNVSQDVARPDEVVPAPEIVEPAGFINSNGITIGELVGKKVILIDFWTYSCINCQRTLPYLTDWYAKYANRGLEIIGIHTPEFEFEKKYDNVAAAVAKFGIEYPVVLDNDYGTWQAYGNRYWPRKYLIDINGNIVYDHIGEGGYQETEQKIQELLAERSNQLGQANAIDAVPLTQEVTDEAQPESPETYFGALRNRNLGNGQAGVRGEQTFSVPEELAPNELYLDGVWQITDEYAENTQGGARIVFPYQAKKVYMVARADEPTEVMIRRDGEVIDSIIIQADQLYTLIADNMIGEHTLELIIVNPGLQAFTFTFG